MMGAYQMPITHMRVCTYLWGKGGLAWSVDGHVSAAVIGGKPTLTPHTNN